MNKKGFIENWGAFFILSIIGYVVVVFMFTTWGKMDFIIPMWQKIIVLLLVPIPAGFFTKMMFE